MKTTLRDWIIAIVGVACLLGMSAWRDDGVADQQTYQRY